MVPVFQQGRNGDSLARHRGRWDDNMVLQRVSEIVNEEHSSNGAIGVIDETGFSKKGKKTPGIQRQYCGETGKTVGNHQKDTRNNQGGFFDRF